MTVNSTRDFIPPEPFEGQNYKPRYARNKIFLSKIALHLNHSLLAIGTSCTLVTG